jgi:hypothetical protein
MQGRHDLGTVVPTRSISTQPTAAAAADGGCRLFGDCLALLLLLLGSSAVAAAGGAAVVVCVRIV